MVTQKYLKKTLSILNLVLAISMIAAVFYGGQIGVNASTPTPPAPGAKASGVVPNDEIGGNTEMGQMRTTTNAMRIAAAARQKAAKAAAGVDQTNAVAAMNPLGQPDYFGVANWANSPLPSVDPVTGVITGGMKKFNATDTLPGFCPPPASAQPAKCIPLGQADTTTFSKTPADPNNPNADFYDIGLVQYREQLHSDLPATGTKLVGYVQLYPLGTTSAPNAVPLTPAAAGVVQTIIDPTIAGNATPRLAYYKPQYLGPIILAHGCDPLVQANCVPTPVRVKFENLLPADTASAPHAGDLFIPTDTTYMGAGEGSKCIDGSEATPTSTCQRATYSENRATLHLHGGNTPWISDGTPHQWTVPAGEATFYAKGDSVAYVPDMWFTAAGKLIPSCAMQTTCAVAGASTNPGPGSLSFYWTNQQSGRMMFYHDHAYGATRTDVYAGEAAGYLVVDNVVETALIAAGVPSPNGTGATDITHVLPLVIQDKTFVPDDGTAANSQLAATDPTWSTAKWGSTGDLWFPHVYMPNQNPADVTGANAFGRWDYGAWFWPAQNPATFVASGQPYSCSSSAYSVATPPAYPPLMCPGTPNPSGTPEAFMDTPLVNGTAYPTLTVDPSVYRFQMLNAANDRTLNLSWFVAEPLTIAVTVPGSGYSTAVPPTVTLGSGNYTATPVVSTGFISGLTPTAVGSGYLTAPAVTITGDGTGAVVTATVDPISQSISGYTVVNGGAGYTYATAAVAPLVGCVADPAHLPLPITCTNATATVTIAAAGTIESIIVVPPAAPTVPTTFVTPPTVVISAPPAGGTQAFAMATVNTEVKMVDAVPHTVASALKPCSVANADPSGPNLAKALLDGTGNPLNGTGLQTNCYPDSWPVDGRAGGVPDPLTAGPAWVQLGTEGGSLPAPVVIPPTPTNYEYNRRSITVLNIFTHGLLIGPAERADVVVDFSKYAGKTVLLYNDAPAPVPAFDTRTDYYTGDPDQTSTGGAPTTLPGYGPNTRTIMQVTVNATGAVVGSVNMATLTTNMAASWGANQDKVLIPQTVYPASNGNSATSNYVKIQDNYIGAWIGNPVGSITLTNGGTKYQAAPSIAISGGGGTGATATLTFSGGVGAINLTNGGSGYTRSSTTIPVTISAPPAGGVQATATAVTNATGVVTGFANLVAGSGYLTPPTITIAAPTGAGLRRRATATTTLWGSVTSVTLTNGGSGYTSLPSVAITPAAGDTTGAGATASLQSQHLEPKAIQELFTLDYGRMNATLGVELPFTNFATQTTIPYGYVDPPTEMFQSGETQVWKITHNGVDTHFMHFHLFNVQVINRVGWDGAIKPPEANEIGWKDTVRMNPLEDIIVAMTTLKQKLPWELPNSVRRLDVTQPVGTTSTMAFANIDPANQPATVVNDLVNYGFEYVWHCHILGHEENDMMRAMILGVAPNAPTGLVAQIRTTTPPSPLSRAVKLAWNDNSLNETGFTVQRSTDGGVSWPVSLAVPLHAGTGLVTYFDTTVQQNRTYWYRVIANNVVGYTQAYAAPIVGFPWKSYDSAPATMLLSVTTNNGRGLGIFDLGGNAPFLFASGFESMTNWLTGVNTGGATVWTKVGDVLANPLAAMGPAAGANGMLAVLSSSPANVTYAMADGQTGYDASFYFDANKSDSGSAPVDIFVAKDTSGNAVFGIQYQVIAPEGEPIRQLSSWVMHGATKAVTPWIDLAEESTSHYLEVAWNQSNQAWFTFSVDGNIVGMSKGDTHTQTVKSVVLGLSSGLSDTSLGTMYFDDFSSATLNVNPPLLYLPLIGR